LVHRKLACATAFFTLSAVAACHGDDASHASSDANAPSEASLEPVDAGIADAGRGKVATVGAASFITTVSDMTAFPESKTGARRMGYLRAGATAQAYDKPIVNEDCKTGWYELVSGGFVCSKTATFDLGDARVKHAPKQPDLRAGMPYRYGVNLGVDTPLYRRVLSVEDRKKYEPWLAPKPPEEPAPGESADDPTASTPSPTSTSTTTTTTTTNVGSGSGSGAADDDTTEAPKHDARRGGGTDAGAPDRADAGPPKLKELRGRGVLVRRMVRGFYLALDRDFKAAHAHWWRTTFGFAVPYDRVMVQPGVTKHHGAWFMDVPTALAPDAGMSVYPFDASTMSFGTMDDAGGGNVAELDAGTNLTGAVGFINNGYAHKVEVKDDKPGWGPELPRRSAVMLTGRTLLSGGTTYEETTGGFWVRSSDVMVAKPQPPKELGPNEKWIDVDLTRQALVAFEGMRPVFATLISSGRRNKDDKEKDFPTPTGNFRIREKHVTTTMDGDVASDGPYSIEDVPWVMYFEGSYALHGAFWHDQFGNKRSHGCVNLAPEDARTLFSWTEPKLPDGWHGVYSRDDLTGTRLVIHEDKEKR
jgi:hypothetical protein